MAISAIFSLLSVKSSAAAFKRSFCTRALTLSSLLCLKVALAVGGAVVGLVLSVSGYEANAAQQSEAALNGIYALMTWVPAIGYLLCFLVTHFLYKLDGKTMSRLKLPPSDDGGFSWTQKQLSVEELFDTYVSNSSPEPC